MLISPAYAQSIVPGGFDIMSLMPLVLIFLVFYLLLIRPQQKKVKVHREMISNLRRGDRVVTSGGIIGLITRILNENEMMVEIAEGVRVKVARSMISSLVVKADADGDDENDGDDGDDGDNGDNGDDEDARRSPRRKRRKRKTAAND